MLADALGVLSELLREQPLAVALLVIVLEIPRYTFSFFVLALFRIRPDPDDSASMKPISVIIPVHNGGAGVAATIESLCGSGEELREIIIVDDGSTDETARVLDQIRGQHPRLRIIRHRQRTGKSAAVNHAARFATGELLLLIDADTLIGRGAVRRLATAFADERVAVASGNIIAANAGQNPVTALQALEYLLSITAGRTFLGFIGSMSCCSGAFSMFRKSAFDAVGGLNVGPGEDLEITLRFRKAGYRTKFVRDAVGATGVPETGFALFRQRLRWDRDALCIRLFMYRQLSLRSPGELLSDTLQRLDFILLELLPTLAFPFYLTYAAIRYPEDFWLFLQSFYVALFFVSMLNVMLAFIALRHTPRLLDSLVMPVLPIYQGLVMRLWRFFAFSQEILFSTSHKDPFVPERVRAALYSGGH